MMITILILEGNAATSRGGGKRCVDDGDGDTADGDDDDDDEDDDDDDDDDEEEEEEEEGVDEPIGSQ